MRLTRSTAAWHAGHPALKTSTFCLTLMAISPRDLDARKLIRLPHMLTLRLGVCSKVKHFLSPTFPSTRRVSRSPKRRFW